MKNIVIRTGSKNMTKRTERNDRNKDWKFHLQKQAIRDYVQNRRNLGDPCSWSEVYDMLRAREDCYTGLEFFSSFFFNINLLTYLNC